MGKITDALMRAASVAQEHNLPDQQEYDPLTCQCCGYTKSQDSELECVCDQLPWYMLPGGGVECQAHKFARAGLNMPGVQAKRKFWQFK